MAKLLTARGKVELVETGKRTLIILVGILILLSFPSVSANLNASLSGGSVRVTWHGTSGEVLRTNLDLSPVTRVGYGQVDVFQKHSTFNMSFDPVSHVARTITIQNRESADSSVTCDGWTTTENSSTMYQCRWNFQSVSGTRADWSGQIWATIYDRLPYVFIGFEMTTQNGKGEEKNSEWTIQLEARDGFFELDGAREASSFGLRDNFGWQTEPGIGGMGQVLIAYGGTAQGFQVPGGWTKITADSRFLKAFKTDDDLIPDGQTNSGTAVYQFVHDFNPVSFSGHLQFYRNGATDYTLESSQAVLGTWRGWDSLRGAYSTVASNNQVVVDLKGLGETTYTPTILVEDLDCRRTVNVLNRTALLVEGTDYGIHRNPGNRRCYIVLYDMNSSPQEITIKKGIDVTPPTFTQHSRTLATVWNHTHVGLSARIKDISEIGSVAIWHNGNGGFRRYTDGVVNNSGVYSYWLTSDNYTFGDTVEWYFEATDASPGRNKGLGAVQSFDVPEYRHLEIGGIYICDTEGFDPDQDFGHEYYDQKFVNILRGQGYPFDFYSQWNITLDRLAKHPILVIASEMVQDSAWDYSQYNTTDPSFSALIGEYLEHGCGDIVFLNPGALWSLRELLGIEGDWFQIVGLNREASAEAVEVRVLEEIPGITPARGTSVTLRDGNWGNDNHLGEGWMLLNTTGGSWGDPREVVRITVEDEGSEYWIPLGYWNVGPSKIWLALPKWTTRGRDLIGEPHDGETGWLFKLVEHSLESLSANTSGKIMPFMTRHGSVSYALNGLRSWMTSEEQEEWIEVLTRIEETRDATGTPKSLYIGAIPLYSPLRPDLLGQGADFWQDDCNNDTGIESDPRLVTGLSKDYTKWFTGGNEEYNARGMNWIINGSRPFIMLYNRTGGGPHYFKIDTDGDLDFEEEAGYRMYQDYEMKLEISGEVQIVTFRGVTWEGDPNIPWTLLVMDDISHQVDTSLFDFINSRDWIRVGIHYPWMAAKPYGSHWGRSIDESAMWPEEEQYLLCRSYFEDALAALGEVIDSGQIEPAFTPSEHTIDEDYMKGFADAGMVVHISNWQALFGPERYVGENPDQWFYNMFRGQEGGSGPSNWMPIVDLSGITARNLGIDIDSGGRSFFPQAASDMEWMNENGWLNDYSDLSIQVSSIMDAWRFWKSTLAMLGNGCKMVQTPSGIRIEFTGSPWMEGITWMLPAHDFQGNTYHQLLLDGVKVLANLTLGDYLYFTMPSPGGDHVIELRYTPTFIHNDPRDDDPLNLSYTVGSTGNRITWRVNDWEENQGSYVILKEGLQVERGKWYNGLEIGIGVDGLPEGNHSYSIIYWDSRSPKKIDTVSVSVLPIVEFFLPSLMLISITGLVCRRVSLGQW